MKEQNFLALIVAYYLSKFNTIAYKQLGYETMGGTHSEIGRILGVNPNSIKNMRDEFDPLHENLRVGWYQRPLRPSRDRVVRLFHALSEQELRDIVLEILNNPKSNDLDEIKYTIEATSTTNQVSEPKSAHIVRGPTGHKAEELFIEYFKQKGKPIQGELKDTREHGCGYDFEIHQNQRVFQVGVKGLDGETGEIVFTSKEWEIARKSGLTYYLVVVRNVSSSPTFQIIRNPASVLSPRQNIYTVVETCWNVNEKELSDLKSTQ